MATKAETEREATEIAPTAISIWAHWYGSDAANQAALVDDALKQSHQQQTALLKEQPQESLQKAQLHLRI